MEEDNHQHLEERLKNIEQLLGTINIQQKDILTLEEGCLFLNLGPDQMYKLTSSGIIKKYQPGGKIIYLKRADLVNYVLSGEVKTRSEIDIDATTYITTGKRRKRKGGKS
jgi:hypothetical protein